MVIELFPPDPTETTMSDLLQVLPIYAFMLIPVWIPLIAMSLGGLSDLVAASSLRTSRASKTQVQPSPVVRTLSHSAGPQVPAARTAA